MAAGGIGILAFKTSNIRGPQCSGPRFPRKVQRDGAQGDYAKRQTMPGAPLRKWEFRLHGVWQEAACCYYNDFDGDND